MSPALRIRWQPVLDRAAEIVASYDTGVTLRQLFYRLVAAEVLPNTQSYYKSLSDYTAKARRAGTFPALIDPTREIHRPAAWNGPGEILDAVARDYRRDRTEGQPYTIYMGVEKRGSLRQLQSWFDDRGIPILPLGGYTSQTFVDEIAAEVGRDARESVLLYAGDFDPSGEDILRDLLLRTGCFDQVVRVALTADQVVEYNLPPQMGKAADPRAAGFVERHGELVQVEQEALPPDVLRALFEDARARFWDVSESDRVREAEQAEREQLEAFIATWDPDA
jgi:hypothetical protein